MVNWQSSNTYKDIKRFERESGFSFADYNRMNNPYYGQNQGIGAQLAMAAPSIFLTVLNKFASSDSNGGSGATASSDNVARSVEDIKKDIQNILDKYNNKDASTNEKTEISSIDDLKVLLESKLDENDTNLSLLEKNIQNNTKVEKDATENNKSIEPQIAELETLLGNGNGSYNVQIQTLEANLNNARANNQNTASIEKQLEKVRAEQIEATEKLKTLKEQKELNDKNIADAQKALSEDKVLFKECKDIEKDIKNLEALNKELKKAEGTDTIETLTNEDTANIANLIKKLNKAEMENNASEQTKLKEQLTKAIEDYLEKPGAKNPTILNYAKKLGLV